MSDWCIYSNMVQVYLRQIEKNHNVIIQENVEVLLCPCTIQIPPDIIGCGKYPSWCIILRCRMKECKAKKIWNVCIKCINVVTANKKMYGNPELKRHNELHLAFQDRIHTAETAVTHSTSVHNGTTAVSTLLSLDLVHTRLAKNLEYYAFLQKGRAMNYLVNKQFHEDNVKPEIISNNDAELHTLIAYVSLSQSKNENAKFAQLINLIDKQHKLDVQQLIDERNYYK